MESVRRWESNSSIVAKYYTWQSEVPKVPKLIPVIKLIILRFFFWEKKEITLR